ncbi:MAG: hypothetical protein NTZ05_23495 [Chloroflexi bacterium]|nr:hypothetical protein [Chloroflexota bacterium]
MSLPEGWADKLLDKFPAFDPAATPEAQAAWWAGFERLMAMGHSTPTSTGESTTPTKGNYPTLNENPPAPIAESMPLHIVQPQGRNRAAAFNHMDTAARSSAGRAGATARWGGGTTITDAAEQVMRAASGPLYVTEITDEVRKLGVTIRAEDPSKAVVDALLRVKRRGLNIERTGDGQYTLVRPAAKAAASPR